MPYCATALTSIEVDSDILLTRFLSPSPPRCAELEALLGGARCEIEVLEESVSQMIGGKAAVTGILIYSMLYCAVLCCALLCCTCCDWAVPPAPTQKEHYLPCLSEE